MRCQNCDQPVNSPDQHIWCCDGECTCKCSDCDCEHCEYCWESRVSCGCNCTRERRKLAVGWRCVQKQLVANVKITGVDMNSMESIMLAERYEDQKAEARRIRNELRAAEEEKVRQWRAGSGVWQE